MKAISFLFLVCIAYASFSQREYGVYDSTFHVLNTDTTLVAAQKKLYIRSAAGLTLVRDFTTADSNYFIRDFDIVTDSVWYTIVGNRYIGGDTELHKTRDKGMSWELDTSFYAVGRNLVSANFNSLNQLQRLSDDTLVLFIGYYESGIAYSTDGGTSWNPWFRNLIAFYQGIFFCERDCYLYGLEGDGFPSSMFKFADTLLFSPDTNNVWTHWTGGTYHPACYDRDSACIFAPNSINRYSQYRFHRDYVDSICSVTTSNWQKEIRTPLSIYPNPLRSGTALTIGHDAMHSYTAYRIFNHNGKLVQKGAVKQIIDTSRLTQGMYLVSFRRGDDIVCKKLIIQ